MEEVISWLRMMEVPRRKSRLEILARTPKHVTTTSWYNHGSSFNHMSHFEVPWVGGDSKIKSEKFQDRTSISIPQHLTLHRIHHPHNPLLPSPSINYARPHYRTRGPSSIYLPRDLLSLLPNHHPTLAAPLQLHPRPSRIRSRKPLLQPITPYHLR